MIAQAVKAAELLLTGVDLEEKVIKGSLTMRMEPNTRYRRRRVRSRRVARHFIPVATRFSRTMIGNDAR